ncbi:BQ5605_C020g09160 [Microbotryum silenes-dioicae]|uniref:BQ5605_C020g09160 protein n=1 Tax=Microbotryum silenes-dioicae TaxID=796604 RepID=A0A2X0PDS9_9BASI|nr:BQ5605_C020g09160 [Microbotryum silenes-dioicae]
MSDPAISTLVSLPSLQPFVTRLSSLLCSAAPPPCLHIHAPTNSHLVLPIIHHILDEQRLVIKHAPAQPSVQELLPRYASVELNKLHSTRQLFDRVLNKLSGFAGDGDEDVWDERAKAVACWDGRNQGCEVVKVDVAASKKRSSEDRASAWRDNKRRRVSRLQTQQQQQEAEDESSQDEEEAVDEEANEEWVIRWNRSKAPPKSAIAPIHDTLEHFFVSLSTICSLGKAQDYHPASKKRSPPNADRDDDDSDAEEFAALNAKRTIATPYRFIILDKAEKLSELPSAGTVGGAPKETGLGMTFSNAMRRVGSLVRDFLTLVALRSQVTEHGIDDASQSRLPISTIFISSLAPTKLRDSMVGNVEPQLLVFPDLGRGNLDASNKNAPGEGIVALLTARFAATQPAFSPMTTDETVSLFRSLVQVLWSIFSNTYTEVNDFAHLAAKFWPSWLDCLDQGSLPVNPNRISALTSLMKAEFAREHERHGAPRQSSYVAEGLGSPKKNASTPTKTTMRGFVGSIPDLPARPNYLPSPSSSVASPIRPAASTSTSILNDSIPSHSLFSAAAATTPLAKRAKAMNLAASRPLTSVEVETKADQTLASSLPFVARMLILASFYAAFNPPKSDVRVFVKVDEGIARKGKKGRQIKKFRVGNSPTKVKKPRWSSTKIETSRLMHPPPPSFPIQAHITSLESGGKAFPLERLLAIFEALVDDPSISSTIDVQMQVATLINLRLLQRVSAQDKVLDGIKLRCRVGFETVDMLARSCGMKDWKTRLHQTEF